MKFAEYLQENLVPEWKDRYLDYKGGKKKIKKINDSPKSLNGLTTIKPLSQTRNLRPSPPPPGSTGTPNKTATPDNFSNYRFNSINSNQSFELPPAALDPLDNDQQQIKQPQPKQPVNDHTPLLAASNERRSPSYNGSIEIENILAQKRSLRIPQSTDLTATASIYGTSVTSQDERDIALENFNKTAYDNFIQWLDKELYKINSFYKEKETKTVERFLLIQDQLFMLKEERERFKKSTALNSNGKSKMQQDFENQERIIKAKMKKLQKLDLPSFPKFTIFNKSTTDLKLEETQNKRDYEVHQHVPYYSARRQLKLALQEFYRELELLRSYRMLNRTGFRKLVKKCDKKTESNLSSTYVEKVNNSYFCMSDIVENLIPKVEDLYSGFFENGNRKIAVERLRSDLNQETFYGPLFLAGLFLGIGIPLALYAFYLGIHKTINKDIPEGKFLLQIWGGFFLMLLIVMFFVVDCYIWTKFKVNYKFIFEFNPKTALDFKQFTLLPAFSFLSFSLFFWFSANNFWPNGINSLYWPWFYLVSMIFIIFCPLKILYYDSRKWLISTMWRLFFSGFYPVEFKDFFLGDIFCSLSYSMGNISFFFCMYTTHWKGAADGTSHCSSGYSRLMGFFATLPPIWRFLQCVRRYFDSGDWFPHLANMVKYGFTILYYVTLSVYRIDKTLPNKAAFVFFAIINSVFSGVWDILMDWSLMQNKNLLRDDLVFPKWFYYFAMVSDIILRFQWVFYALFGKQIEQSAFTSFGIGIIEIFRRFIWLLIRMENEHVTNIHLYRASRETPLPYETIPRATNMSRIGTNKSSSIPQPFNGQSQDIEFQQYHAPPMDIEAQPNTDTLRRRKTLLDPEMFKNLSNAIGNAHAKDFQRKKPQDGLSNDQDDHISDDDDENSDDEEGSILGNTLI